MPEAISQQQLQPKHQQPEQRSQTTTMWGQDVRECLERTLEKIINCNDINILIIIF